MNTQVKCDGDPRHGCGSHQLSVAQESGGGVMVAVKERERLLLDHQKHRVNELNVLCDVVELQESVLSEMTKAEKL